MAFWLSTNSAIFCTVTALFIQIFIAVRYDNIKKIFPIKKTTSAT